MTGLPAGKIPPRTGGSEASGHSPISTVLSPTARPHGRCHLRRLPVGGTQGEREAPAVASVRDVTRTAASLPFVPRAAVRNTGRTTRRATPAKSGSCKPRSPAQRLLTNVSSTRCSVAASTSGRSSTSFPSRFLHSNERTRRVRPRSTTRAKHSAHAKPRRKLERKEDNLGALLSA